MNEKHTQSAPFDDVLAAYGARANEYAAAVGRIEHTAAADRDLVRRWARGCTGPLLDVGCGPGQWTHWLSAQGVQITGIDPVPEFIELARAAYPDACYRIGRADSLGVDAGSLGGVLAWYSLIHADETDMTLALAEFARCLRPGGGLLLGLFANKDRELFDHAVVAAHFWPLECVASMVESAGFTILHATTRTDPGKRTHGEISAVRETQRTHVEHHRGSRRPRGYWRR